MAQRNWTSISDIFIRLERQPLVQCKDLRESAALRVALGFGERAALENPNRVNMAFLRIQMAPTINVCEPTLGAIGMDRGPQRSQRKWIWDESFETRRWVSPKPTRTIVGRGSAS